MTERRTSQGLIEAARLPAGALGEQLRRWAIESSGPLLANLTPERISGIFRQAQRRIDEQIQLAHEIEQYDDHLRGTLQLRRAAVTRMERTVEAGDPEDPRSRQAAELAERMVGEPWYAEMLDWLMGAVLKQWAACELVYEPRVIDGRRLWMVRRVRTVEPRRWWFDEEGRPYFYRDLTRRSTRDVIEPVAGKYAVHNWAANSTPGDFAMVRAVAKLWYLAQIDLIDWGLMIEQWGIPVISLTYREGLSEEEIQEIVDRLWASAGRRVLATPEGTGIATTELPDQSPHEAFQTFYRRAISRLLLGQDSSQMAIEGQNTGATLQGSVRDDIRDADARKLEASLAETLWGPWCRWNFGPDVAPPVVRLEDPKQVNPAQRGAVYVTAAQLGLSVYSSQLYEELELERPPTVPEVLRLEPPAAGPAAGGMPAAMARRAGVGEAVIEDVADEYAGLMAGHADDLRALAGRIEAAGGSDAEKFAAFEAALGDLVEQWEPGRRAELLEEATLAALARGILDTEARLRRKRKGTR